MQVWNGLGRVGLLSHANGAFPAPSSCADYNLSQVKTLDNGYAEVCRSYRTILLFFNKTILLGIDAAFVQSLGLLI